MFWREDGHVLSRTLDLEVEDQRKKHRPKIDRHHSLKSDNIPKTEGGQIHLNFMTVL